VRRGRGGYPARGYVWHPVRRALARGLGWLLCALLVLAALALLAPVTLVAAGSAAFGWWRGWPPRRLYAAAAWCLPMVTVWLAAVAVWPARVATAGAASRQAPSASLPPGAGPGPWWLRVAAAPGRAWLAMLHLTAHGHLVAAAVAAAPPAVPLGIAAGGLAWAYRMMRMQTGTGGLTPASPAAFDARQWGHQVRTARAVLTAPGALPLISPNGHVVTGATIRSVGHRAGRAAAIPYARLRSHQVVIGSTGTGKTTLLLRLWAGFMAAGLRRYADGAAGRPLLVVLDCKGGASSRKVADRARRVLRDAGARSTAIWPDEASLSLWALPPARLVTTLLDLIEHGTGGAAYYTDVMEALVSLAVEAPCGPPAGSADFLDRLNADWLYAAYAAAGDAARVAAIRSGKRAFDDASLRFRALWRRLGAGLDGGGSFADADAWYCILEGTAETAVAEAQARALIDLLACYATEGRREILLAVDEFSSVSRRLPIWRLYERARSLGLAVQVSAQSWEGLAGTDDERNRVAATAEGGIWLLCTPRPEPIAELAGTRSYVDTSRQFSGAGAWEDSGSSRTRRVPVLDADIVRRLDVGQAAYLHRGGVTYVQVKRLTGRQAALAPALVRDVPMPGDDHRGADLIAADAAVADTLPLPRIWAGSEGDDRPARPAVPGNGEWPRRPWHGAGARAEVPDVSEVLDEAFGRRRD